MSYAMLVNQRGEYPNCQSQVSAWQDDPPSEETTIRSEWFPSSESRILSEQLQLAERIRDDVGANTPVHVLRDGVLGFIPLEPMAAWELVEDLKEVL